MSGLPLRVMALAGWLLACGGVALAGEGFPLIVGHRGAQGEGTACENTMKVFRWCWQNGGDLAEMDVRSTADGVLVLMHDETVDRTTDGTGRLDAMAWSEVAALGRHPDIHPSYGECRVPRLDDVLAEAMAAGGGVLLHLKELRTFSAVRQLVEASGIAKGKVAFLVDANTAREASAVFSPGGYRLWYTTYGKPLAFSVGWAGQLVQMGYGALVFYMAADVIPTAEEVAYVRGLGLRFGMSSANGGVRIYEAMRNGVDICLTNFPRRIDRFLGEGVSLASPYLDWLSAYQVGFVLGRGSVRPEADPDGDGLPNLMEMVFGSDPRAPRLDGDGVAGRLPTGHYAAEGGWSYRFRIVDEVLSGAGVGVPIEVSVERSRGDGVWFATAKEALGGGAYSAVLPAEEHPAEVFFRLRITDLNGDRGGVGGPSNLGGK